MKVYLVPGLGYDYRIFENLDFKGLNIEYIHWIEPRPDEHIHDYAIRLFAEIPNESEQLVLVGYSMGGVVSQEIATVKRIDKIILISSIRSEKELPFLFRLIKNLRLHHLFSKKLAIDTISFWGKKHGIGEPREHDLFRSMIAKPSGHYFKWALKALSQWKAPVLPQTTQIFQIHGDNDLTFPIELIRQPDVIIKTGTHFMLYNQSEYFNDILLQEIENTQKANNSQRT